MTKPSVLVCALISASLAVLFVGAGAHAVDVSAFQPGRIIDDELFYKKDDMSVSDIQSFLNTHVPSCDTWGTRASGYGGLTNAQYAQQVLGWSGPPYTCLNNYYENPTTGETSFEKGGGAFDGGLSTAQIVYDSAQQYAINPKVLLVFLRKESLNLFSDSWPLKSQYTYAMGYACPDSGPNYSANCNPTKAGFYKQVHYAAWQLRYYYDHMGDYNYAPGRWNTIQYNTDPACGTKEVYIQNNATASLYIYTPYTPNNAALNAYPGTASCGSYGNRNFWFFWQEWFGSTFAGVHITSSIRVTSKYGNDAFADIPTTVSFDMYNDSNNSIDVGGMAVAVRDSSGRNYDYPLRSMVVPAKSYATYTETKTFNKEDDYTFSVANYSGGIWRSDYPGMMNVTEPRSRAVTLWNIPTLTTGPSITNGPLQTGKTHTITFTVKNNSASARTVGQFGLAVRGPANESLDPVAATAVTIDAGQTRTLTYTFKPLYEGVYKFSIASKLSGWVANYPQLVDNTVNQSLTQTAAPRVVLSTSLANSLVTPRVGQNANLTYGVTNRGEDPVDMGRLGFWGRDPQGRNIDPGVSSIVLAANETRQISVVVRPSISGQYIFGILGTKDGVVWNDGPVSGITNPSRRITFAVGDGVVVAGGVVATSGLSIGYIGQQTNLQITVKNYGDVSVDLGKIGLWGRDPQGRNIDPGVVAVTLGAREERILTFPAKFSAGGSYTFGILQTLDNGVVWRDGPALEGGAVRRVTIPVSSGVETSQGVQSSIDAQHLHSNEITTLSFNIKNLTNQTIDLGKIGLWGRDPQGRNIDPGVVAVTLNPGEERNMTFTICATIAGAYTYGVLQTTNNGSTWTSGPEKETSSIANVVQLVAR